jgi:hypothetical protein
MSSTQIAALADGAIALFDTGELAAISSTGIKGLESADISGLDDSQLEELTTGRESLFSQDQTNWIIAAYTETTNAQ